MDVTHLGHSCLLLDVAGRRILLDPGTWSDFGDQRDLSAILVTHQHPDHADPARLPALLAANPAAQVWLEPQAAAALADAAGREAGRLQRMEAGHTIDLGEVSVTPVGQRHAVIHEHVPRIDNLGVVVRAEGEPSLFHPGDALDADPGQVDILCVPVNAPWARVADVVEFCRRISPGRAVPIHDGLLNDTGRKTYLGHIGSFGRDGGLELSDLRGRGCVTV